MSRNQAFREGVSMVPVESLMPLSHQYTNWNRVKDLLPSIQEEGVREPVEINYNHRTGEANIGEGNHRLRAAVSAGLTHVPAVAVHSGWDVHGSTPVSGPGEAERGTRFSPEELELPTGGYPFPPHPKRLKWEQRATLSRIIEPLREKHRDRRFAIKRDGWLNPEEQAVYDRTKKELDPQGFQRSKDLTDDILKLL